jgi:predicted GIY-YIG superfamily endonuclease
MVLEVRKKERETSQNLVHRFTKTVRQSGILLEKRSRQFHKRTKSHLVQKRSALRREETRKEYERAKKMNKPEKQKARY